MARHGPGLVARHRDAARVAGVVAAVLAALVLSSWLSLLVVAVALVGYQLAVTVLARAGQAESYPEDEAPSAARQ